MKRPRLYFNNIKMSNGNIMVIFQDKFLKEKYGDQERKLVYWMMWNIPKTLNYLEEKIYDKVENKSKQGIYEYFELFPYKLFDKSKNPQYFNRLGTDNYKEEINEDFTENILDRQLELEMRVRQLTKEQTEKINNAYFKYHKSNITEFYKEVFEIFENDIGDNLSDNNENKYEDEEIFKEKRVDLEGMNGLNNFII